MSRRSPRESFAARTQRRWLEWILPAEEAPYVLGDLEEESRRIREEDGDRTARRWLVRQTFSLTLAAPKWALQRLQGRPPRGTGDGMTRDLFADLRYAARQLGRSRSFTAVNVLVLGVGLGANVAMFSFTNAVLLRPPQGVDAPDRLIQLLSRSGPQDDFELSLAHPDFLDLRAALRGEAQLAAHDSAPLSVRVGDVTERLRGSLVSAEYFDVLGVGAHRGRVLGAGDDVRRSSFVTVVSHDFWQTRLGSAEDVVGRAIAINGQPFTVIGVAQESFSGIVPFERSDLWVPMGMQDLLQPRSYSLLDERGATWMSVVGRLGAGVDSEALGPRVESIATGLAEAHPETNETREITAMQGLGFGPADRKLAQLLSGVLLAVASLVLLVACANVANLVLARASQRRGEVALRRALGASRARVARLLFSESLVLSLLAALLGTAFAFLGKDLIPALLPQATENSVLSLALDHRVLLYTGLLALLSAVVFGTAPVLSSGDLRLASQMREGSGGRSRVRLRSTLVVVQLALSVVLLMAAGLLLETMRRLQSVDPGFRSEGVLTASIDPGLQGYSGDQISLLYDRLLESLNDEALLERAALTATIPLSTSEESYGGLRIEDNEPLEGRSGWTLRVNFVSPGFFETLQIQRSEGRDFGKADTPGAPRTAIVNEAFRKRFWQDRALGRTIGFPRRDEDPELYEVVGVVGDARYGSLAGDAEPILYLPLSQHPRQRIAILARSTGDPLLGLEPLRATVRGLDADMPLFGVAPVEQIVESSLWQERLVATLLTLFGSLALILAAVGLYGVVAYIVSEHRREIGIRIAVGASGGEVVTHFLKSSMRLVVLALSLGLVGSLAMGRLLSSFLHGVQALEPVVTIGVLGLLLLVGTFATLLPARAAASVDPVEALRADG
ncbi:MAG: ABC transporter permease [Acidobacteriota bacterium]